MTPEFRNMIFFASGYDGDEICNSGLRELVSGLI